MDTIELEIEKTLNNVANELPAGMKLTVWTRAIKTALTELAYRIGYNVYTSKANDHDDTTNECLYDMLWYQSLDGHSNDLNRIHLALESEWNMSFDEIRYDFYKLIQARAEHRVMIFQSFDINSTMRELTDLINKSRVSEIGDKYLLVAWNAHDDDKFTFNLVVKNSQTPS